MHATSGGICPVASLKVYPNCRLALLPMAATLIVAMCLGLAGCGSSDRQTLVQACVDAGSAGQTDASTWNTHCECAASTAEKNLDADDYHLLVRLAGIYNEQVDGDVKFKHLVAAMSDWGVGGGKAAATALDLILLSRRVERECPVPATGRLPKFHAARRPVIRTGG